MDTIRNTSSGAPSADRWSPDDIGDLAGRTAVVTGSNKGIGRQLALELAGHGARVVVAARDPARGDAAVAAIRAEVREADVRREELDLASLRSVRTFACRFAQRYGRLDVLINNAGVGYGPYRRTDDGFESTFGTNHLGHFALTGLLLALLLDSPGSRVVTVASRAHEWPHARLDFDDLQLDRTYERTTAYARSKLANVLFAFELDRRLGRAGAPVRSVAASPRLTATSFGPPELARRLLLRARLGRGAQPVAVGALPVLYAATAPCVVGGDYVQPATRGGPPARLRAAEPAYDTGSAARLWQLSEELTGCSFGV
ncbi:MAG TPA: oxidoreductase [Actinophytocola sp.]|jgi:NAD(P)-dependent dehydrogenase (short-subunit alcohol dehydrogenase family)|nr:oxidoreductase [Actinophytocola sp.]